MTYIPIKNPMDLMWNMHTVYRAYDVDNTLLYIGVTCDWFARMKWHYKNSQWCHSEVTFLPKLVVGRQWAEYLEARAIRRFRPPHNRRISVPRRPRCTLLAYKTICGKRHDVAHACAEQEIGLEWPKGLKRKAVV